MLKIVTLSLLLCLMFLLGGCQTMVTDEKQQIRKYSRIAELNRRMFAEDIDAYLGLKRSSDLNHWYRPIR